MSAHKITMNQLSHVCRICLVSGHTLRLHSIISTQLQDTFEMLSQTQLIGGDMPKSVCYICRSQLRKCQQLMQFVQESETMLRLMLYDDKMADTVAKTVGSRSPLKLQKIEPVLLSMPNLVNLPASDVKTEAVEPVEESGYQKETEVTIEKELESIEEEQVVKKEDRDLIYQSTVKEEEDVLMYEIEDVSVSQKETEVTIEEEQVVMKENRDLIHQSTVKEEQVLMHEDVDFGNEELKVKEEKEQGVMQEDLRNVKVEVETNMENIDDATSNSEDATENEVNDCEKEEIVTIKKRIAMLKEQIAKEKERKAKEKEKKAIKKVEVFIKQELIAQGDASEEELGRASVKEEIEEEDTEITEYCSKISTESASNEGLVNVSSSKLLNELQKVLRQNSGLLPEIKEMEVDSVQTAPRDSIYKCVVCDRRFESGESREQHMRKHKEDTPYGCRHCRRAFARQAHLDSHMRIHMSEREHECKLCERAFPPAAALVAHMRVHSSERHLCCRKCKKRYKTVLALRDHIRTHRVKRDPILPK